MTESGFPLDSTEVPEFVPCRCYVQRKWTSGDDLWSWIWCTAVVGWRSGHSAYLTLQPSQYCQCCAHGDCNCVGRNHSVLLTMLLIVIWNRSVAKTFRARVRKMTWFRRGCLHYRYLTTYEQGKSWWIKIAEQGKFGINFEQAFQQLYVGVLYP